MKQQFFILPATLICAAAIFFQTCTTGTFSQKREVSHLPKSSNYPHKTTFKVANVQPATEKIADEKDYRAWLDEYYVRGVMEADLQKHREEGDTSYRPPVRRIECFSRDRRPLVPSTNGFYSAAYQAYAEHRPLVISPDMIWLVIAQGFAHHVNQNAEALRHHFVKHSGKKVLEVKMDGKVALGDDGSDWEWVFGQFSDQIAKNTNAEIVETMAGRFSGTNTDAAVAFDITLMDATQHYFSFWGSVMCGIPEITLEGKPEDWAQIEQRAAKLTQYELDWWLKDLQPILAQFTKTSRGEVKPEFWADMIKIYEEDVVCATTDHPTGWILKLFPYLKMSEAGFVKNPMLSLPTDSLYLFLPEQKEKSQTVSDFNQQRPDHLCDNDVRRKIKYIGPVIGSENIPMGISSCILNVDNNGNYLKMELKAGFFGFRQDPLTFALRPEIGWVIIDTGEKPDAGESDLYEKHRSKTPGN